MEKTLTLPGRRSTAASKAARTSTSPWHFSPLSEVLEQLGVDGSGLTSSEAERRLHKHGPNRLPERPPRPVWHIVLGQFRSPLIYILLIAAVASIALGDVKDASFIAAVLLINAAIGAYQEWKAEQSTSALKRLLELRATVVRDGEVVELEAARVVPGDKVLLESGNRVPADVRLLTAHGIEIDESLLTGESLAVHKDAATSPLQTAPVADQVNMAFAGSLVTRGRATGLVVETGSSTQVGRLALDVLAGGDGKAPLIERMERFTRTIAIGTVIAALGIGVLAVAMGRYAVSEMFMFCIALIVSAIPEGLPVAMTVALAVATTRMARRGVIVRRLTAVEGLGSCTLIASDKTGTLTCNELTVRRIVLPGGTQLSVTGEGFVPEGEVLSDGHPIEPGGPDGLVDLIRAGVLCNEADLHKASNGWVSRGDAVDIALLALGGKLGWSRDRELELYPQVEQIPFEPELQFAASFHQGNDGTRVFAKGAPERIMRMCRPGLADGVQKRLEEQAFDLAASGYRVLALADGKLESALPPGEAPPTPAGLRFLGFVAMIDPLRPGVKQAIADCHDAGVSVAMVTGDHRVTALAIARELGLTATDADGALTGEEVAAMEPQRLPEVMRRTRVFARVAPHQKLEIVKAAQASGHFVAVTGDGVNDAPALQAANIGVAMGKSGTDVAREAAELVIRDDNFVTLVAGIEEGRVAYDNIRKVIFLLVSTGAAEVAMVLLTILWGLPLPLLAVQLLWLNLVTNGIQGVALAFEPNEGDVLQRRPRPPKQPIFDRLMLERLAISVAIMGGVGFGAFYYLTEGLGWDVDRARNGLLLLMVLFENIHIGNCRSETKSAFALSPLKSPILLSGALAAFLLHVAAMYLPWGHEFLGTRPVSIGEGLAIFGLALTILPAIEAHKWYWNWRHGDRSGVDAAG